MKRFTQGTQEQRDRLRESAQEGFLIWRPIEDKDFFVKPENDGVHCCYVGGAVLTHFAGDATRAVEEAAKYESHDLLAYSEILQIDYDLLNAVSNAHKKGKSISEISDALLPEPSPSKQSTPSPTYVDLIGEEDLEPEPFATIR